MGSDRDPTFIGRQLELAALTDRLDDLVSSAGTFVLVTGPPGVGKTRLAFEVCEFARARSCSIARARCDPDHGAPPMWPWHQVVEQIASSSAPEPQFDRPDLRFAYFDRLRTALVSQASRRPLLVVLDDLQWMSELSLTFLRYLTRSIAHEAMLVVGLARTAADAGVGAGTAAGDLTLETLAWEANGRLVEMRGFDLDETAALLASRGVVLEPPVLADVHVATSGIPLYLTKLADAMQDPNGRALTAVRVGLGRMVAMQMQRGPAAVRRVVTAAAVLGSIPTVHDVVEVTGLDDGVVADAVTFAIAQKIIERKEPHGVDFVHDLVRDAVLLLADPAEVANLHGRCVAHFVRKRSDEAVFRATRHALEVATRSIESGLEAVELCQRSAALHASRLAYEDAISVLDRAIEIHRMIGLTTPTGRLLVDRASVILRSGQLGRAHAAFAAAAERCEAEGDLAGLAVAAIGLGGIWPNEVRAVDERAWIVARQRRALSVYATDNDIGIRLRARLAAEDCYWFGESAALLREVAQEARDSGSVRAQAETVSLLHGATWAPEYGADRLVNADEMIRLGTAAGDEVCTLLGLLYRSVDQFLVGRRDARRALVEAKVRADATRCVGVSYLVECIELMLTIRSGDLSRAEEDAERLLRLGLDAGDPDAFTYYGGHLLAIRWFQGRESETLTLFADLLDSPQLADVDYSVAAAVAALAARAGNVEQARDALRRLPASGLGAIPRHSTWLATLMGVVEAAAFLEDDALADEAYTLLLPWRELPVMPSLAVVCFGSTERSLGLAARATRHIDRAVEHFERAIEANKALPNRPATAICEYELAVTLALGNEPQRQQVVAHVRAAVDLATECGMTVLSERWWSWLRQFEAPSAPPISLTPAGSGWRLCAQGREIHLPARSGLGYLATLIANPDVDITAASLVSGGQFSDPVAQPVLDTRSRTEFENAAQRLALDLTDARRREAWARVEELERELDALSAELRRSTGLGGRPRSFTGQDERARVAVTKAIQRALTLIDDADPVIGAMLRGKVVTGRLCRFSP